MIDWIINNQATLLLSLMGATVTFGLLVLIYLVVLNRKLAQQTEQKHEYKENVDKLREVFVERLAQLTASNDKLFSEVKHDLTKQFSLLNETLISKQNAFEKSIGNQLSDMKSEQSNRLADAKLQQQRDLTSFKDELLQQIERSRQQGQKDQLELRDKLVTELRAAIKDIRSELTQTLKLSSENLLKGLSDLTTSTDNRLKEISGQVEKRLSEGFEKTTQTFNDVLKRLALIDDAQKKITELSSNVVSLQQVLADKRSRGAFGEVQLNALVRNVLPDGHYSIQHKLSNDRVADCILFLPEPTGNVVIDAKFPLESYQKMTDFEISESERQIAARQFKVDIKKHINDIKSKYIIANETANGAMMFIPAEAVFAEIHGHFPELVELAHKEKVWMVSPTTMMAILTTASAVIKDEATRQQVHIIQEHLGYLAKDFGRFQNRMDNLSKHIGQVSKDVGEIHTSAQKISSRFEKIEQVDLPDNRRDDLLDKPS